MTVTLISPVLGHQPSLLGRPSLALGLTLWLSALAASAQAQNPALLAPPTPAASLAATPVTTPVVAAGSDRYFSPSPTKPNAKQKAALALAERMNAQAEPSVSPVVGANGEVKFVFGGTPPTLVCAVLQICDVALQAGEQVNSIHLGDSVRWLIEPAVTGSGAQETQHLIIKPLDSGLDTSLVVTTNRRVYHLRLTSDRRQYMARVAFSYPEDAQMRWEAMRLRESKEHKQKEERTLPHTGEYLGDLSFNYDLQGQAPWKPVRVYNDGRKTIIEMPGQTRNSEAPTLLVLRKEGGAFQEEETVMVNYRIHGSRYIVDAVFDQAILIAGTGDQQDRIKISRRK